MTLNGKLSTEIFYQKKKKNNKNNKKKAFYKQFK